MIHPFLVRFVVNPVSHNGLAGIAIPCKAPATVRATFDGANPARPAIAATNEPPQIAAVYQVFAIRKTPGRRGGPDDLVNIVDLNHVIQRAGLSGLRLRCGVAVNPKGAGHVRNDPGHSAQVVDVLSLKDNATAALNVRHAYA